MTLTSEVESEQPGAVSSHFAIAEPLLSDRSSGAMLHDVDAESPRPDHIMAVVPLKAAPFSLILEEDEDIALALPIQLRDELLVFGGVGFLVTLGVAWFTTRRVARPARALADAARQIAAGDLSRPVTVNAQDEIHSLARDFETMRQRLKSARDDIARSNAELEQRVHDRTAELEEVLGKLVSAQEEERTRLARELHDETAQGLAALLLALDTMRDSFPDDAEEGRQRIDQAKALASGLLAETRRLIFALRPSVLDHFGLVAAIRAVAEDELEKKGLEFSFEHRGINERLPDYLEVTLFRIAQEAINNVARHAEAQHVVVTLDRDDEEVRLTISDDGRGFDSGDGRPETESRHFGLVGMKERAVLLGGRTKITSAPGRGTTVEAHIPRQKGIVVGP